MHVSQTFLFGAHHGYLLYFVDLSPRLIYLLPVALVTKAHPEGINGANTVDPLLCDHLHSCPCCRFKKSALIENNINAIPVNTGTLK